MMVYNLQINFPHRLQILNIFKNETTFIIKFLVNFNFIMKCCEQKNQKNADDCGT